MMGKPGPMPWGSCTHAAHDLAKTQGDTSATRSKHVSGIKDAAAQRMFDAVSLHSQVLIAASEARATFCVDILVGL